MNLFKLTILEFDEYERLIDEQERFILANKIETVKKCIGADYDILFDDLNTATKYYKYDGHRYFKIEEMNVEVL